MTEHVDQDNALDNLQDITPGQLLRRAREAKGQTQADIAARMRLSLQKIKDIENDHYTHFSAQIYLRGHLRTYARLVDIAEEGVLMALDQMDLPQEPEFYERLQNSGSVITYQEQPPAKRSFLRWGSLCVGIILVLLVVMWWQQQKRHDYSTNQPQLPLGNGSQTISLDAATNAAAAPPTKSRVKATRGGDKS